MVFNDTVTSLGICQEIDALCDSTITSYPLADKARRANSALETLIGKIINADGTWQFDDTNFTDLPVGTGTLVASQSAYTFADEFLDIENVKVKDKSGHWNILTPLDQSQTDTPLEDYLVTDGMPEYYDKQGDTIRLYPAPSATYVTLASGLKVQFKRTGSLFTAADTTKEPGIASPYQILIAYMASIPYCMAYKKDRVPLYEKRVDDGIREMIKFYSSREKDRRKVMTTRQINYR
jgi:hypothetical protein